MAQKPRFGMIVVLALILVGVSAAIIKKKDVLKYSPFDRVFYLSTKQIAFVRPGLHLEVLDIAVGEDRSVSVTFTVEDDRGLPLDLDGVFTPGPIRAARHL